MLTVFMDSLTITDQLHLYSKNYRNGRVIEVDE